MNRRAVSLFACLTVCSTALLADFQPANWKWRRPLSMDASSAVAVFNIDRTVYVESQPDLADLRVVAGQDEVPFVIERMSGSHKQQELPSRIIDQGVTSRGDLELTLDVADAKRHNAVRISSDRTNFRARVSIATSDNGRDWTRVRDDGYLFNFSQDAQRISAMRVNYPVSTRRYVRVTIHGWNDPKAVAGCWVSIEENQPAVRDAMASLHANPEQDPKTQSTIFTWDLGRPGIPHDQLALDVETPAFERAAAIETSSDGKQWSPAGSGVLFRFSKDQSTTLEFPASHSQFLRLRIYNRDDRPLIVKRAELSVIRSRVIIKPVAGNSYFLYYSNADARAPSYDLRELLARETPAAETKLSAGKEEPNPFYREKPPPRKPWSEQHPEILYITLGVAVIGMGIVTIRFLRTAGKEIR